MPKVSVIIPCYNQVEFLEEAIASVKNQTFKDYEIIIVNDGSTEHNAIDLINDFASFNIFIIHEINKGVSAARNKGIELAQGEFILPLDADDEIHPHYLEEAVEMLENKKQFEIVITGVKYFGALQHEEYLPEYSRKQHLLQNLFFNTSLFRKKSFFNAGGYDEDFKTGWEDWDFYLRLINNESQIGFIPKYYYNYRIKKTSRNADLIDNKKNIVEQQLFRKYLDEYIKYFPDPLSRFRKFDFMEKEIALFEDVKHSIYYSISYRIGNMILYPFKVLKNIFSNIKNIY
jgi:glycosyltransferase involved in cell wall biosynthesis